MIYHNLADAPGGHYNVIEADPAWHHSTYSPKGQKQAPSRHYKTMSLEEICALDVKRLAAKDCHLMLWTTQPHLQQSFEVMKAWGFKYSSVYIFWLKLNPKAQSALWIEMRDFHQGMGFTTRKNIEVVLLGRRGSPKRLRKDMKDFIIAPRREHSRKPESFYTHAAEYAAGPRMSLFSRQERDGWDSWGFEADKFKS